MKSAFNKIRRKSFSDVFKAFLRIVLKTNISKFHYLTLDLAGRSDREPDVASQAKRLTIADFQKGDPNVFKGAKVDLIKNRLASSQYQAFGIIENGHLIYSTWISEGKLTMPNGLQFPIQPDEALLEDSYCAPSARGRGLHSKMNEYRIQRIKQMGKRRVIAIVLDGNTPAMKVQTRSGFKEEFTFKCGYILGIPFATKLKK